MNHETFVPHNFTVYNNEYMTIKTPVHITSVLENPIHCICTYERLHLQAILQVTKIYIQICVYTKLNFCQTDANIHFGKFLSWSTYEYACCMDVSKDASPDYKHKLVCIRYGFMATTNKRNMIK